MRYNIVQIALLVLLSAFVSGCNDFLDKVPDDRTEINTVEKAYRLLVTAYPSSTFASILEYRADGYMDMGNPLYSVGNMLDYANSSFLWREFDISPNSSDSNQSYWAACYNAIAVTNHALGALKKMDYPAGSEHARAEAYVARAYAHFCLVSMYANMFERGRESVNPGVPYVTEPEEEIHKEYDRETVAITLEKIWIDFERGMRDLQGTDAYAKYELEPKFHFTPNSANAFAVRYNLFTQDYAGVISYASKLIGKPGYVAVLDDQGAEVYNKDGSLQIIVPTTDLTYIDMGTKLLDRASLKLFSSASGIGYTTTDPERDANLLVSEVVTTMPLANTGGAYNRYILTPMANSVIYGKNVTGGEWNYRLLAVSGDPQGFAPKTWHDFKYKSVVAGIGYYYARLPLFKMDEVLLARAEAYTMLGDYNSALLDLNMYIQKKINDFDYTLHMITRDKVVKYYKNKVVSSEHILNSTLNKDKFIAEENTDEGVLQRALIMTVLDFRRSEFVYEGMRYFDVLRWNIPVEHIVARSGEGGGILEPDDPRRVLQLPESAKLSGLELNIRPEDLPKVGPYLFLEKPTIK